MNFIRRAVILLILIVTFPLHAAEFHDPISVYLTWQRSPQTTMTVHWITSLEKADDSVEYQMTGSEGWNKVNGSHARMPTGHPYLIHTAELTGLSPSTDYKFRIGSNLAEGKFKTLSASLDEPLKFVVGGDLYHDQLRILNKMNKAVAARNPHFVILGGDIAYSYPGRFGFMPEKVQRWIEFLATWSQTMIDSSGRLIPLLPVIGNHEVKGNYDKTNENALSFYALFSMPGSQGYNLLDFGNYLSILLLDSGHTHPIDGDQRNWIYYALKDRQNFPHKFAVYHVPAYPSVRPFDDGKAPMIRNFWVPIFDEFGLSAAFEHNDHAFKRSHPLKGGKIDPKGVLYMGDGGWGVTEARRPKKPSEVYYLAKTMQSPNALIVTIFPDNKRLYQSIDQNGQIIDEYSQP